MKFLLKIALGKQIGFAICKENMSFATKKAFNKNGVCHIRKGEKLTYYKSRFGESLLKGTKESPKGIIKKDGFKHFKICNTERKRLK